MNLYQSFFRFLGRHKAYTAIDIFGLSVSLMFVILIVAYAQQEFSVDKFHEHADRIYMLGNEEHNMSAYGIAERIQERYPEVEDFCYVTNSRILSGSGKIAVETEGELYNTQVQFVNDNFFRFFSFPLLYGNKDFVMANKYDAVISESFARKVFKNEDPIGKYIKMEDSLTVVVNGIMNDLANTVIMDCDILVRTENLRYLRRDMDGNTFNNALSTNIFLLEREGTSLASKADEMRDYFKGLYWFYEREIVKEVEFIPITEAYYAHQEGYMYNKGDKRLVMILLTVGILILLFAVINYINLTVAQTGFRAKEMATRNLLGSSRYDLFSRLIIETTLLTFVSFLIGLILAFLFVPYANQVLDTKIHLESLFTLSNIAFMILLILAIGCIAGLFPALLISRTKAVEVVKGTFRQKTKMVFSKFFITFQNAITISLVAAALIMFTQVNHLIKAPLGYNTTNIIEIGVEDLRSPENARILANELSQLSTVKLVSLSAGTPFNGGNNNTVEFEDRSVSFQTLIGDSAFMGMLGIEIIRENNVSSDDAFYVSEYALKEQNLPLDAETFTYYDPQTPIAGVIKDFQLNNILLDKRPILIQTRKRENFHPWNILVEIQGDPYTAWQDVKRVYEKTTRLEFDGKFTDHLVEESFKSQKRTSTIVVIFTWVAILLSLLGLLAMSTYFVQQRSREIGLRKVFGSSTKQILVRLVGTFLNYVLIAFIIATPVIWYLMKDWLDGYTYRIKLTPGFFVLAGLCCLFLSFITVFWQSYTAATSNPVERIKTE